MWPDIRHAPDRWVENKGIAEISQIWIPPKLKFFLLLFCNSLNCSSPWNSRFFAYVISRKRSANQRKKNQNSVYRVKLSPHAKIQLLLNTFKNGRKIKGSFLLWAFHFFICISIAGQIATCFIFLCQYTCVYKKHLTMESTLVSTSCFDSMFSLDSEEVHPLEVPQQICLELPQLNTQYQEINVAWSSEKVRLWWQLE